MIRPAIVIPIYKEFNNLNKDEIESLNQCLLILFVHPIIFVGPLNINGGKYIEYCLNKGINAEIKTFSSDFFLDTHTYNRLLVNKKFYLSFKNYSHILIYQLDAYVFKDELNYWCQLGFDYIGSPWIKDKQNGILQFAPSGGNGGFSLRKIDSHIRILGIWKIMNNPKSVWHFHKSFHNTINMVKRLPFIFLRILGFQNNSAYFIETFKGNEDSFWSLDAIKIDPNFKVASVEVELNFSFEKHPSYLYQLNNNTLPFGCHAWPKHEPEFWKSFIKT